MTVETKNHVVDIDTLTEAEFTAMPLVIVGESKEVRYAGCGQVVIRFLPTVYSFTHNRCANVPGSHIPRLRCSKKFVEVLAAAGIQHAYLDVNDHWVLARLLMPHDVEFEKYGVPRFVPPDITPEEIATLPVAPPIEIVIKRFLTGTTLHGCHGMAGSRVRASHPFYAGMQFEPNGALPEMIVRFDWRNPLQLEAQLQRLVGQADSEAKAAAAALHNFVPQNSTRDDYLKAVSYAARDIFGLARMADMALPEQLADCFIDVHRARRTALLAGRAIERFLADRDIVFYDLCLFIDESGELVYGEISPDCGRYRHVDLGQLDKDVWRAGGSSDDVLKKWMLLTSLIDVGDDSATKGGQR